eukprot:CAMPEP_0194333764 /NCGR_PEP_ID=MMETSP0171-20130528/63919_1 /TAXON_ID=218684 /ORGANISM="Corethron pennatum, Strain L29A3" /LENGTH=282 /DNA_ID=CAMNT_0039096137 /DNA_START=14 /DNA_END=858 /DNA_ORIENTATION=-
MTVHASPDIPGGPYTPNDDPVKYNYNTGNATIRACRHRVRYDKSKNPTQSAEEMAASESLRQFPGEILIGGFEVLEYDTEKYPLREVVTRALVDLLDEERRGAEPDAFELGHFLVPPDTDGDDGCAFLPPLESMRVNPAALTGRGGKKASQRLVSDLIPNRPEILALLDDFVKQVVLPHLKCRLLSLDAGLAEDLSQRRGADGGDEHTLAFHYQRPPTLRLQPGPSTRHVRTHADSEYGHQPGELNFWMPLTSLEETRTTLWAESAAGRGDFAPFEVTYGQV